MWQFYNYRKAIDDAGEMLLEASYNKKRRKLVNYEMIYDWKVSTEASYTIAIQEFNQKLKINMKKMKSSIKKIDEEIEVMDNYEEKFTRFQNRKMIKKQLEVMFESKVIRYFEEEKKRREMEKLFIKDNKFIISKKLWSHLRNQKEKLYLNKRVFRFNERNWNILNLNKGVSFDWETMGFLCNNFKRKSFLDRLDDYRCQINYINKLKEYKFDSRIELIEETINYLIKKKQEKKPIKIQNIHFLSIHENEEMLYPERIERYWLNINERNIKLNKNGQIEEKTKLINSEYGRKNSLI
jgi:hypothetical protein